MPKCELSRCIYFTLKIDYDTDDLHLAETHSTSSHLAAWMKWTYACVYQHNLSNKAHSDWQSSHKL